MEGAVQMYGNLQEQLSDHLHFRYERTIEMLTYGKMQCDSVFKFFIIELLLNEPRESDGKHLSISLKRSEVEWRT